MQVFVLVLVLPERRREWLFAGKIKIYFKDSF